MLVFHAYSITSSCEYMCLRAIITGVFNRILKYLNTKATTTEEVETEKPTVMEMQTEK